MKAGEGKGLAHGHTAHQWAGPADSESWFPVSHSTHHAVSFSSLL